MDLRTLSLASCPSSQAMTERAKGIAAPRLEPVTKFPSVTVSVSA